ncbi:MAG TPA: DinB family protein [Gemmatimonadales bacterium]|nr:DinB family protein [Gemmatimonadales bacterium]
MLSELSSRLATLDETREAFLAPIRAASDLQRSFRPAPGAWSMLDVTEHLVLAEEKSLLGMLKGPPPGTTITPLARVRMAMVLLVMQTDLRVKVPVARVLPTGSVALGELEARWGDARRGLERFLEPITEPEARSARFRHPIGGWVSVGTGVTFYAAHIRHHARQVRRLHRAAGFPAA